MIERVEQGFERKWPFMIQYSTWKRSDEDYDEVPSEDN
jgi:hypothetical protein